MTPPQAVRGPCGTGENDEGRHDRSRRHLDGAPTFAVRRRPRTGPRVPDDSTQGIALGGAGLVDLTQASVVTIDEDCALGYLLAASFGPSDQTLLLTIFRGTVDILIPAGINVIFPKGIAVPGSLGAVDPAVDDCCWPDWGFIFVTGDESSCSTTTYADNRYYVRLDLARLAVRMLRSSLRPAEQYLSMPGETFGDCPILRATE